MKNFFAAVKGKFDARYDGRYLGNILESIAGVRKEIVLPLIDDWPMSSVQSVSTECSYLVDSEGDRQADLEIELLRNDGQHRRILVEIKMFDSFLPGQLEAYVGWARQESSGTDDRRVVVLTAFPLTPSAEKTIKENGNCLRHIYLSEFLDEVLSRKSDSELIDLFANYLCEEGYAMYQLTSEPSDYEALHSFMVLNFLPHASGHKKVATAHKISRGPAVFGLMVQNWQLVSDRLASVLQAREKRDRRRPTIRYFPQQAASVSLPDLAKFGVGETQDFLETRRQVRNGKNGGRYWMTSDYVFRGSEKRAEEIRIEWGQVLEIRHGRRMDADASNIDCSLYALIRMGSKQLAAKVRDLDYGIMNAKLYNAEQFMSELMALVQEAANQAKMSQELEPQIIERLQAMGH